MRTAPAGGREPSVIIRRTIEYDAVSTSEENVDSGSSATRRKPCSSIAANESVLNFSSALRSRFSRITCAAGAAATPFASYGPRLQAASETSAAATSTLTSVLRIGHLLSPAEEDARRASPQLHRPGRYPSAMLNWVFDLPLALMGPAIIAALCLFGVTGMLVVRRSLLPRLLVHVQDSEFSGAIVQCVMVFYGLAVALIAVNVFQTYSDVTKMISQEATSLAALYRDVTSYPEPIRATLQDGLREYTHQVIYEAWPIQRRGEVPTAGVDHMNRFQSSLLAFEPTTEGQKLLHAETLRAYNTVIVARRLRVDAVTTGLPGVMWVVIVAGALISLSAAFFFKVEDARLHGILVTLLATFMGLVIFMILSLDRPFRGDLAIQPGAYQLVYDQLMKR